MKPIDNIQDKCPYISHSKKGFECGKAHWYSTDKGIPNEPCTLADWKKCPLNRKKEC